MAMRQFRTALIGLGALVAFLFGSSQASATLSVLPVTSTAMSSAGPTSLIESTGSTTQLTCSTSSITDTVASDGSGTIAAGGASFATCTLGIVVAQTSAWTSTVTFLLSGGSIIGVGETFTIPTNGLHLRAALGCDFYVSGSFGFLIGTLIQTPPNLYSINNVVANRFGTALGLRVTRIITNSLCSAITLGDLLRLSSEYNFSPWIRGTLI